MVTRKLGAEKQEHARGFTFKLAARWSTALISPSGRRDSGNRDRLWGINLPCDMASSNGREMFRRGIACGSKAGRKVVF
jgi:hypothetical protein